MSDLRLAGDRLDWREVDEEVIALERRRAAYLGVNRSGTLLWRALAQGASEERLTTLLMERYGVELEVARRDVRRFVAQLREHALIQAG